MTLDSWVPEDVVPDPSQPSLEAVCSHNWGGYCAFLLSEFLDPETRQPCRLCPQWATGREDWKERLKVPYKQGVAKFLDLVRLNPSLAKMYGLKPLKGRTSPAPAAPPDD